MMFLKGRSGIVPAIWFFEIANAIIVAERRGRIREPQISRTLELIATVSIEVDQGLVHPTFHCDGCFACAYDEAFRLRCGLLGTS
jgi:hypothetical protein